MRLTISILLVFFLVSLAIARTLDDEIDEDDFELEMDDLDTVDDLEERGWRKWGKKGKKKKIPKKVLVYKKFLEDLKAERVNLTKPDKAIRKKIAGRIHNIYKNNRDFGAESIRLSFHDCVGGNCDGCLDLTDPNNFGLDKPIKKLKKLMLKPLVHRHMSRADLIAFAAKTNIRYSIKRNNKMCGKPEYNCPKMPKNRIRFTWGRVDCGPNINVTRPNDTFPSASMGREAMMSYFRDNFGFNESEVTVLLGGVHSLGRARKENSGYDGAFRLAKDGNKTLWAFNNGVFKRLTNGAYEFRVEADDPDSDVDKKFKFGLYDDDGKKIGMMLPTDVSLAYNIDGTKTSPTTCKINAKGAAGEQCPQSATYAEVEKLAKPETRKEAREFMAKFSAVFTKMIEIGHPLL